MKTLPESLPAREGDNLDDANKCMKCGFCMYNCPIYKVDHIPLQKPLHGLGRGHIRFYLP